MLYPSPWLLAALAAVSPAAQDTHPLPASGTELPASGTELPASGIWRAWLDCPGGQIPFGLELRRDAGTWSAWLRNGPERAPVGGVEVDAGELRLRLDPYDSRIVARVLEHGRRLEGQWLRYRGAQGATRMRFAAVHGDAPRFAASGPASRREERGGGASIDGRWSVQFAGREHPSVGLFETRGEGSAGSLVEGTFLTTLGDYRFLEGDFDGTRLRLSCFDGAHAFLFTARIAGDGTLAGDFWSRDSWHETWSARRDSEAALPDPFGLTRWKGGVPLAELSFPDADGVRRSLGDPAFAGEARVLVLFGTWCPNCNDQTRLLVELDERYRARGLSILALAFEFGDDFERNARLVQQYAAHHSVRYPILVAGTSDKREASRAFPLLDRVRAFPTTVFLDADGVVAAIHTGFSGPATGAAHTRLREDFERVIEGLLSRGR